MGKQFDKNVALKNLDQQLTGKIKCPYCENEVFNFADRAGMLLPAKDMDSVSLSQFVPMAMLTCVKCGYTSLFSTAVLQPDFMQPPEIK
jgi:predicted nucleic-acid-binding Zn-ribbon protein